MYRGWRRGVVGVVAVAWGLGLAAAGYAAPAKALYVRLALPPTGQKTMLLKFRGEGNSPVRSVLVADRNLNGVLEPSEAVRGRAQSEAPTGYAFFDFESVRPRPELTGGIAWSIGFAQYRYVSGKRTVEQFMCMLSGQTDRGAERWTYQAAGPLAGTIDPAKAPLCGASGKPALKLETRPDGANPGQTGFGVSLGWPTLQLYQVARGSATHSAGTPEPVPVKLRLADTAGRVVHDAEAALEEMGFG